MTNGTFLADISKIDVGDRLRELDAQHVEQIALSMRDRGQLQPIEVSKSDREGFDWKLVIGGHRVAGMKQNGEPQIEAKLFEGSADEARLREIDENLYRHELNPFDQAAFLAERKEIYERLYGKVASGRPKRNRANQAQLSKQMSFFDETTKKFGLPRRTIQRALQRKENIDARVWGLLRGTKWVKKGADLDALAKLMPAQQLAVAARLTADLGPARSLRQAMQQAAVPGAGGETKTPFDKLVALSTKAGERERKLFVGHFREIGALAA